MKNEHYALIRDLFHALSLGAFGVALFPSEAGVAWRVGAMLGGFYCHLIAHAAISYDRGRRVEEALRERRLNLEAERVYPTGPKEGP